MKRIVSPFILMAVLLASCVASTNDQSAPADKVEVQAPLPLDHTPEWSYNDVMYEVNIRQYSEEGTFEAFAKEIPRLQEMGVDILWFMPIHPIGEKNRKGSLGSYYSIQDYKAVNPEFGTLEEFKSVVEQAHAAGMKVIIDWVANHSAWDTPWITEHPEYYTTDSNGNIIPPNPDWSDVADLNYDNEGLRVAMIDAMKFWLTETDIDGFRCDVAGEVPMDFWDEAIAELRSVKPIFMLAEWDDPKMHSSFNATYGWGYHHTLMEIGKGHYTMDSLRTYFEKDLARYPEKAFRLRFNTNHDENSWKGTEEALFGPHACNFQVLAFTASGMPLLYSGQESGLNKQLLFFENDLIDWGSYEKAEWLKSLAALKHEYPALQAGMRGGAMEIIDTELGSGLFVFDRKAEGSALRIIMNGSETEMDVSDIAGGGEIVYPADASNDLSALPAYRTFVVELND